VELLWLAMKRTRPPQRLETPVWWPFPMQLWPSWLLTLTLTLTPPPLPLPLPLLQPQRR
jgi:hypothetical protein